MRDSIQNLSSNIHLSIELFKHSMSIVDHPLGSMCFIIENFFFAFTLLKLQEYEKLLKFPLLYILCIRKSYAIKDTFTQYIFTSTNSYNCSHNPMVKLDAIRIRKEKHIYVV